MWAINKALRGCKSNLKSNKSFLLKKIIVRRFSSSLDSYNVLISYKQSFKSFSSVIYCLDSKSYMGDVLNRKFFIMYIEILGEVIHLFCKNTIAFDVNWNLNQRSFVHYQCTSTNDRVRNSTLIVSTQTWMLYW